MNRPGRARRSAPAPLVGELRRHGAFRGCCEDDIVQLVRAGTELPVPATWAFIQEGTPADAGYLLLAGRVRVFSGRREVAVIEAGDLVGEMALIDGGLRQATVASTGSLRVLHLDYGRLEALLHNNVRLHNRVEGVYSRHRAASAA